MLTTVDGWARVGAIVDAVAGIGSSPHAEGSLACVEAAVPRGLARRLGREPEIRDQERFLRSGFTIEDLADAVGLDLHTGRFAPGVGAGCEQAPLVRWPSNGRGLGLRRKG